MDEATALPSPRVLLSRRLKRYYGRLRLPPGTQSTSRLSTGYRTGRSDGTHPRGRRAGEGLPSSRRHPLNVPSPHTPGGSSGLHSRLYAPSVAFAVTSAARLLLFPPAGGVLTTRQTSLNASDRSVAPPTGLLTLRFDPGRFPPKPAACYRASWQLPGPDLPRLATTSLCWISYPSAPPTLGAPRKGRGGIRTAKPLLARLLHRQSVGALTGRARVSLSWPPLSQSPGSARPQRPVGTAPCAS